MSYPFDPVLERHKRLREVPRFVIEDDELKEVFSALKPPHKCRAFLSQHYFKDHQFERHGGIYEARGRISNGLFVFDPTSPTAYLILPVWCRLDRLDHPLLENLLAFHPAKPEEVYLWRRATGVLIGRDNLRAACAMGSVAPRLRVFKDPLSFVLNPDRGLYPFDLEAVIDVCELYHLIVQDIELGRLLERVSRETGVDPRIFFEAVA